MSGSVISTNIPSDLQSNEQKTQVVQKAILDLQRGVNAGATAPAVLVHLPSTTDAVLKATTSATPVNFPGYAWTINSRGGLVVIEACLNGSISQGDALAPISLVIDGKTVLTGKAITAVGGAGFGAVNWTCTLVWKAVLGKGQHTISVQGSTNAGTLRLNGANGTDRGFLSSASSIIEFPANVADLNVNAA